MSLPIHTVCASMPLPRMRGMRGGQGLKGTTVGQPTVQQQGKLRTANLAKRGGAAPGRQHLGLFAHAVDADVSQKRAELPHPTQASDYLGLQIQVLICPVLGMTPMKGLVAEVVPVC